MIVDMTQSIHPTNVDAWIHTTYTIQRVNKIRKVLGVGEFDSFEI